MNTIQEDLKAFLDGELSPERAAEVQAAIDADPTLREEVEFMKALGFEIKKMKAEPAVQGAEKAMAGVRRGRSSWLLRNRWMMGSALTAVMLLVIVPPMLRSGSATAPFTPTAEAGVYRGKASAPLEDSARFADGAAGSTGSTGTTGTTGTTGSTGLFGSEGSFKNRRVPTNNASPPQDWYARGGAMESDKGLTDPDTLGGIAGKEEQALRSEGLNHAGPEQAPNRAPAPSRGLIPQFLIRTANVAVKVESAQKALADSIRIAQSVGGYSSGDNLSVSEGTTPTATVSLRVPVKSFEKVREDILKLGTMIENNSNTEDVTTQVADTEARLKVMRAEEDSYVTMLRGARKIGELMEIKDRLSSIRQEIESLDSQKKALRDQASYSTINATFTQKTKIDEPAPPKEWTEDTWANAVNGLKSVGRFLAQGAIFLFVYSPLWLPVLLFGWWMSRRGSK